MSSQESIKAASMALAYDGVILCPTDTIWGLSCNAKSETAIHRIYTLKQRNTHHPLIVLGYDYQAFQPFFKKTLPIAELKELGSEKPSTFVIPNAMNISKIILSENDSLAIRVPDIQILKSLLKEYNGLITSTSANISGYPFPISFNDIDKDICNNVDYILTPNIEIPKRNPSRILQWKSKGGFSTLRD